MFALSLAAALALAVTAAVALALAAAQAALAVARWFAWVSSPFSSSLAFGSSRLALNVTFESFVAPFFEMYKHLGHAKEVLDVGFSTDVALLCLQWLADAASRVFEQLQSKSAVPKRLKIDI